VGNAIRNANRPKPAPRDKEARGERQPLVELPHARKVSDLVLGARVLPAVDARQERPAADAEHLRDLARRNPDQLVVGQ
jgi:hypothetical protein